MLATVALAAITLTLLVYILGWARRVNRYWEERGVVYEKPLLFFGNQLQVALNKKHPGDIMEELSRKFPNEGIIGYYDFLKPKLIVSDPDLVEKVLIKDFIHFVDHGVEVDEETNPLDVSLFTMNGNKWRSFRYKLSPLFTTGKLKFMYSSVDACGENLKALIDTKMGQEMDLKEVMSVFSMDVVGSAVFGIDAGVLKSPDSKFRQMGFKIINTGTLGYLKFWLLGSFPMISKKLRISILDGEASEYFCGILRETFKYRSENNIQRNDFVQMLLQLKEKGVIGDKSWDPSDDYLKADAPPPVESYELDDMALLAQALTFLTAGFEAVGLSITWLYSDLSQNPEIQERARTEVLEQVEKHDGLTYEALKAMHYLEMVLKESQRLHPAAIQLFRVCTKQYTFPNGFTVYPGERLVIPVSVLHMDPNNFTEPTAFKPERFENNIRPGIFLPFGDGPRVCIAMRFAMMQMKYAVAKCLMHYRFKLSPNVKLPLRSKAKSLFNIPTQKILFLVEKL